MPELPDVLCYVEALNDTVAGHEIVGVSLRNPFVVRTSEPLDQVVGRTVGDGADAVPQKRWRAKRDGGASGRGLPH